MTTRLLAALATTAVLLGGCNETITRTTMAGKPVVAAAAGNYTFNSCETWEPPEPSLWVEPKHGRVTHGLHRLPLKLPGNRCDGRLIDYRISLYTPNPGFRGQDKFTLKYDSITNDAGGRETRSRDFIIEVK
ncbi:hypothetical protein ACWIGM_25095 [Bosea sp. NPDC055332]